MTKQSLDKMSARQPTASSSSSSMTLNHVNIDTKTTDNPHDHDTSISLNPPVPVPIVKENDEEKVVPVDGTLPAGDVPDGFEEGKEGKDAVEMIDGRPKDIYDRFTKSQKNRIVAIVSYSAFLSRKLLPYLSSLKILPTC
jgi:hypothetical protein